MVTCLPNTDATRATVDLGRAALRPGTVWIDATSGRPDEAGAVAGEPTPGRAAGAPAPGKMPSEEAAKEEEKPMREIPT